MVDTVGSVSDVQEEIESNFLGEGQEKHTQSGKLCTDYKIILFFLPWHSESDEGCEMFIPIYLH